MKESGFNKNESVGQKYLREQAQVDQWREGIKIILVKEQAVKKQEARERQVDQN